MSILEQAGRWATSRTCSPNGNSIARPKELGRGAVEIERRVFGVHHMNYANAANSLVATYIAAGKLTEAESLQHEVLAIYEQTFGRKHTAYAGALGRLSEIAMARGRYDEAIALRQHSIDIRRQLFGIESAAYGIGISRLAQMYARKREFATADSLFNAALVNQRRYVPETHYEFARSLL